MSDSSISNTAITSQNRLAADYEALLRKHGLTAPHSPTSAKEAYEQVLASGNQPVIDMVVQGELALKKRYGYEVPNHSDVRPNTDFDGSLDMIRRVLKDEVWKGIEGQTFFGLYPTGDFNAVAVKTANGYLCLLHDGLMDLIVIFSMLFAKLVKGMSGQPDIDVYRESSHYKHIVTYLVSGLYQICIKNVEGARAFAGPAGLFDEESLPLMGMVGFGMKTFIVGHELGHIAMGHLNHDRLRAMNTQAGELNVVATNHRDEFEADQFANLLLVGLDEGPTPEPLTMGGPCVMGAILLQQIVAAKIAGHSFDTRGANETHPPSLERYCQLVEHAMGRKLQDALEGKGGQIDRLLFITKCLDLLVSDLMASKIELKDGKLNVFIPSRLTWIQR